MKYIFFIFIFISCAKFSYIIEQGVGQISLEYNDIDVDTFLSSNKYSKSQKHKVQIIINAKNYFYEYFSIKKTDIYDEVKILDRDAVTYLVIHSPHDRVSAIKTSFPVVGSFPYLGFFSQKSAKEYAKRKESEGFQVYIRDVYAYSTLNHPLLPMDDNILSSFFYFSDEQLVELIFHELIHTIVFIKNDIKFNENLASFIARKMTDEYFNNDGFNTRRLMSQKISKKIRSYISLKINELNKIYKNEQNNISPQNKLSRFLDEIFRPQGNLLCRKLNVNRCFTMDDDWNNAKFASYGTYEEKQNKLEILFNQKKLSTKEFIKRIILIKDNGLIDTDKPIIEQLGRKL